MADLAGYSAMYIGRYVMSANNNPNNTYVVL